MGTPEVELQAEQALVARAQAGDRGALGAILTRHGPALYRSVLLPRLGSAAAAEEALGDTYARVVERIGQFRWQGCGVYPWLRAVAMHVALDILRARRREVLFQPEDLEREAEAADRALDGPDPAADVIARRDMDVARRRLEEALGRINARYAAAIRMRVVAEKSREEVARELGVTVATFDVILHRAMAALRKAVGSLEEGAGAP